MSWSQLYADVITAVEASEVGLHRASTWPDLEAENNAKVHLAYVYLQDVVGDALEGSCEFAHDIEGRIRWSLESTNDQRVEHMMLGQHQAQLLFLAVKGIWGRARLESTVSPVDTGEAGVLVFEMTLRFPMYQISMAAPDLADTP